jgi:hypothetical protein
MSNERRSLWLAVLALALLAPTATAQGSPTLTTEPTVLEPGASLVATLRVPAALLDVSVQARIVCSFAGSAGNSTACDETSAPLEVRLAPGGVEYVLLLVAPQTPGTYELTVTRAPAAGTTLLAASATATIEVVAAIASGEEPTDGQEETLTPGATGDGGDRTTWNIWNVFITPGGAASPDASGGDGARWLVATTTGTATLVVILAASRGGFGGIP